MQDLNFKLQCRLKIFGEEDGQLTQTAKSLLASASRFALVFVGSASSKLKGDKTEVDHQAILTIYQKFQFFALKLLKKTLRKKPVQIIHEEKLILFHSLIIFLLTVNIQY